MWDYRNELIHRNGDTIDRERNKGLPSQIRQHFFIGSVDFKKDDKYLFKTNLINQLMKG